MPGGSGPFNAYTDIQSFKAHAPALSLVALLGVNTQLSAPTTAGVSSLPVLSSTGVQPSQLIYLLDGPNSEIVLTAATNPAPDGSHIALANPTVAPHLMLASVSSGGNSGALGALVLEATGIIEQYCQQGQIGDRGLYSAQRVEKLRMPTTRAYLDPNYSLVVRPLHFPILSVAALTMEFAPGVSVGLSAGQVEIDSSLRSITVPYPIPTSSSGSGLPSLLANVPMRRGAQGWLNITYTAGVTWSELPWEFTAAANLAVQELVGYRQNPTGAALVRQGDTMIQQRLRGSSGKETSVDSLLLVQAKVLLEDFRTQFI